MDNEAKGRWCMLRCAGGAQDNTVMDQIMLRFRPIAPKPISNDAVSGNSSVNNKNLILAGKRTKRKYVRVRKNNNGYKRKNNNNKNPSEEGKDDDEVVTTLQLLPEKTDLENSTRSGSQAWCSPDLDNHGNNNKNNYQNLTNSAWLEDIKNQVMIIDDHVVGAFDLSDQTVMVESLVTVESVTYTCMDARGLGHTDDERMNNLKNDTCPGFISDVSNRVRWVNGAYKRMVLMTSQESEGQPSPPEFMVWLTLKEKLPSLYGSFTARVRLQYTWQKEKYSQMVPCDVYRMDNGGFAWRLDVEAALSLGRRR